jgi:hypothetical protein
MVCAVLVIAWHLFVLGLGIVIGITIECNMEEEDERIDSTESED